MGKKGIGEEVPGGDDLFAAEAGRGGNNEIVGL